MVSLAPAAALKPATVAGGATPRSRIVLLSEYYPPSVGGSAELFASLYSRLEETPITVLAAKLAGRVDERAPGVIRALPQPASWGLLSPGPAAAYLAATRLLNQHVQASTVVHCGRLLPEGLTAWLMNRWRRVPYICWVHGEELAYIAASRELSGWARLVHRGAARLIANSHNTRGMLEAIGVPARKIRVVHPGVDVDRFRPDAPGAAAVRSRYAPNGELLLLTVGRLQRRKGHDLVLEALAQQHAPSSALRYIVVGDGEERERLRAIARDLRLEDRVAFLGKIDAADLPAYYAAADIFVHPNRVDRGDFEGFGLVFLEAAASGIPVIGGRSGGVPEALEENSTGLLVSGDEAAELRRAIEALVSSPERRDAMGRAGRRRVLDRFTWAASTAALRTVHDEVARVS